MNFNLNLVKLRIRKIKSKYNSTVFFYFCFYLNSIDLFCIIATIDCLPNKTNISEVKIENVGNFGKENI